MRYRARAGPVAAALLDLRPLPQPDRQRDVGLEWRFRWSSMVGASPELLGKSDDDALGATQEAEPVAVLVLRDLADEFATVAAQAGNDVFDVVDGEHDAAYAQRVRRRAFRLGSDRRRRVELRQLEPAVAIRGPHHGDVGTDVVEPDDAVHPA